MQFNRNFINKFILFFLSFIFSGHICAADLAINKVESSLTKIAIRWTGFYMGLNTGAILNNSNSLKTISYPGPAAGTFENESLVSAILSSSSYSISSNLGFIGGGQLGYNRQVNMSACGLNDFILGFGADIQGIAQTSSNMYNLNGSSVPSYPSETMFSSLSATKQLNYLGTIRGQIGYLIIPELMVYGTGGLAYGGARSMLKIFQSNSFIQPGSVVALSSANGSFSSTLTGWSVGGGAEWMFKPNWSIKLEYIYYDLGNAYYALSPSVVNAQNFPQPTWSSFTSANTRFNGNVLRVGLSYHFNFAALSNVMKF